MQQMLELLGSYFGSAYFLSIYTSLEREEIVFPIYIREEKYSMCVESWTEYDMKRKRKERIHIYTSCNPPLK